MRFSRTHLPPITGFLLIAVLTLLTYITLFYIRALDDNRLTSWQWCFQGGAAVGVFFAVSGGVVISYLYASLSLGSRYRAPALFILAFASSALFWAEPEVIVDASRYFTQAKHLELYGVRYFVEEWGKEIGAWTDMPLLPFLYGVVFRIFGEVRTYVQIFTSILFASSVVLTYMTGRELWDEEVGFYGGTLLLAMPYLFTQTPLMLVDMPSTFFLLLAVFTFLKALKKGGPTVLLAGGAISFAFFTKYSMWLMLSVLAVIAAVHITTQGAGRRRDMSLRTLYTVVVATVLIGAVCIYKSDVLSDQMNLLITYQKPGLKRWEESFLSTFLFQVHPFVTALAVFSVYIAARKRDMKYVIVIWLVILVVALQIKRIRYIVMVFPMLSLAASYGLRAIQGAEIRKFISACAVTSSLAVAFFAYLPFLQNLSAANLKGAGEFINALAEPNVEVFTLLPSDRVVNPAVSVPILDIFTAKHIRYDYRDVLPSGARKEMEHSSLRFTLDYRNPRYYLAWEYAKGDTVVAVISEDIYDILPDDVRQRLEGRTLLKTFDTNEDIFRYRTCVRVYGRQRS